MGKSHAECQREYRECLKEKNTEMYLKQDQDRKRIQGEALMKTTKYEDCKAKDRMTKRKQKKSVKATSTSAMSSPSHSSPLAISSSFLANKCLVKLLPEQLGLSQKVLRRKHKSCRTLCDTCLQIQKLRYSVLLGRKFI